ncbi:MAG: hypothetical protein WCI04_06430 [archaeon]
MPIEAVFGRLPSDNPKVTVIDAGIFGLGAIAIKDIAIGEANCRKVIGAFANMPNAVQLNYKGFISEWLVEK